MSKATTQKAEATSIFDMNKAQLAPRMTQISGHLDQIKELLPGAAVLTAEVRDKTTGKLKEGEIDALRKILAVAHAYPHSFVFLADKDEGKDPNAFEVDLILQRFDALEVLAPLVPELEAMATLIKDTLLRLGELSKPIALKALEIVKPMAAQSEAVRTIAAGGLDFYRAVGQKAAQTKAKNKKNASDAAKGK